MQGKLMMKVLGLVTAAGLTFGAVGSAQTANSYLYFDNASGPSPVVNVYMDGQLIIRNAFSGSPLTFPVTVTSGEHTFVVTPNDMALGQKDIVSQMLTVPAGGTLTLSLTDSTNDSNDLSGYSLSLDTSTPDSQ